MTENPFSVRSRVAPRRIRPQMDCWDALFTTPKTFLPVESTSEKVAKPKPEPAAGNVGSRPHTLDNIVKNVNETISEASGELSEKTPPRGGFTRKP